jgi:hypothetical protein
MRFELSCFLSCVLVVLCSAGCTSTDVDGTDHHAGFYEVNVRKELGDPDAVGHLHLEGVWTRADGDTSDFDYTIDTVNVGVGLEGALGTEGWGGCVVGGSLQHADFDANASSVDEEGIGPYSVIEGGWHATTILEPYGRMFGAVYFPDVSTMFSTEAGVRFHIIEHCALFAAWRYAHYGVEGLDGSDTVDSARLDATGIVIGLSLAL